MRVQWPLPPGYGVEWTLRQLQAAASDLLFCPGDGTASRALTLPGGGHALVHVRLDPTAGQAEVTVEGATSAAAEDCLTTVRHMFGLDLPLVAANAGLGGDPLLRPLVARYQGLRVIQHPSLYECLLSAIISQQVSTAAATGIRRRFLAALGTELRTGNATYTLYPDPATLAALDPERLQGTGVSRAKARYMQAVAAAAAAGELERSAFAGLDDAAAMARLCTLPGIGRWSAEIGLMWGLGRLDVFPAGDLGLRVAVQQLAGLAERPEETDLRALAEPWRPWRSYAAFYLWQHLNDVRAGA